MITLLQKAVFWTCLLFIAGIEPSYAVEFATRTNSDDRDSVVIDTTGYFSLNPTKEIDYRAQHKVLADSLKLSGFGAENDYSVAYSYRSNRRT